MPALIAGRHTAAFDIHRMTDAAIFKDALRRTVSDQKYKQGGMDINVNSNNKNFTEPGHLLYRNKRIEQNFRDNIYAAAAKRYGEFLPQAVWERIAIEEQHIFENGYATMFFAISKLAEFSSEHGYPVSFRGTVGNLIIAYLTGISANDPMELELPWESCLGLNGDQTPQITLNVAAELQDSLREYLKSLLPECDVIYDLPDMPPYKIVIVPKDSGLYDPGREYFSFSLCPHKLMSMAGKAMQRSTEMPQRSDLLSADFIAKVRHMDISGIPVFSDLDGIMELVRELKPVTFDDLVRIMGVCLSPEIRFQIQEISWPDMFDQLIGTREDVYDICIQSGISKEDAFYIMQHVRKGNFEGLPAAYMDMLGAKKLPENFMRTARSASYLYPRGQCAEYIYWALFLAWSRYNSLI